MARHHFEEVRNMDVYDVIKTTCLFMGMMLIMFAFLLDMIV